MKLSEKSSYREILISSIIERLPYFSLNDLEYCGNSELREIIKMINSTPKNQ